MATLVLEGISRHSQGGPDRPCLNCGSDLPYMGICLDGSGSRARSIRSGRLVPLCSALMFTVALTTDNDPTERLEAKPHTRTTRTLQCV